ncbi:ComEC/Rec2 family competence protein [Halalkalibacterium halodurans]
MLFLKRFLFSFLFGLVLLSGCDFEHEIIEILDMIVSEDQSTDVVAPPTSGEATITFFDVGQGDSTLIRSENYTVLVDTGRHDSDAIFTHLEKQQIDQIDLLILTHPHADHIGNADEIVRLYSPEEVWIDGNEATSKTFENVIDALLDSEAEVVEPRAGDVYERGDFLFEIVNPTKLTGDLNNDSIAFRLTYGDVRVVMTGDAEEAAEQEMVASGTDLEADIFKVAHHGSSTSNQPFFLDEIEPTVAIYSAGEDNSYGHPHREVTSLLNERGIDIFGTDIHGTVLITTDGHTYSIQTEH